MSTGAPRVFNGRVIVGYASTTGATRGFVTAYDAETGKQLWRLFIGAGNGFPGNRRVHSDDKGDNLFIASIVALDAKTGAYK